MTTDYRATLNITLSDKDPGAFPQRASLPTREPEFQKRWAEIDLYRLTLEKPAPRGSFILHDGPPYSNGDIHLGHALNKIAKDIVTRYRTMQGYNAPYVPGWDNHGMPIENAVAKKFREEKKTPSRVELRKACREYAAKWIEIQKAQFKRLGVRGDWDDPYLTMNADFEAKIVEVFSELANQGFIYRGLKPVMWCGTCETALADAEVEYEPHISNSIYVRFPLKDDPNGVFSGQGSGDSDQKKRTEGTTAHLTTDHQHLNTAYAVIWTTTPWTIPANLAIAAHPDEEYSVVQANPPAEDAENQRDLSGLYLVATALVESVMQVVGVSDYETVKTLKGSDLTGLVFQHPLFERNAPILLADYVTMDTGTGLVHTAPGHGKEDFDTGIKYGLEVLNPVNEAARYTSQAGEYDGVRFEGMRVIPYADKKGRDSEANVALIEALTKSGNLLHANKYEHSYPHCWRCHSPLIFRATVQWFMNIDHEGFRQKALDAIGEVTWYPKESINRITSMVGGRPDWCVSRQRSWGVGIPAFYCDSCGEAILKKQSMDAVVALVKKQGSDAWYEVPAVDILPEGFTCPNCGAGADKLRKETDVLDVWFDSGSTNRAVLEGHWSHHSWPADLYLEGGDQHRGWFNSSLMIGVGTKGRAPYKTVVTNGWTLDENGEAFSKSKGNGVNPLTVIEQSGADVLRCWVASQNFMEDTRCGDNLLKQVGDNYRGIRNTFRFLLNNLYDFDPATDSVPEAEMEETDRWVLAQLAKVVKTATASYEVYEFHRVFHAVFNFCTVELSAFYLDVLKDRLYASAANAKERRSAQTAMFRLAETLARLLAPVLVHTSEEVWDFLKLKDKEQSVHLAEFPQAGDVDEELITRWEPVLAVREVVKKALEEKRISKKEYAELPEEEKAKVLVNTLEAGVEIVADEAAYRSLLPFSVDLPALFTVSQVKLTNSRQESGIEVSVAPAVGEKCVRCWLIKTDVGTDSNHPELCARCVLAVA